MPKLSAIALIQHLDNQGYLAELQASPGAQTDMIMYVNVLKKKPPVGAGWVSAQPKVSIQGYQPFTAPGLAYCKAFKDEAIIPETTRSIQMGPGYVVKSNDAIQLCTQLGIIPPKPSAYH